MDSLDCHDLATLAIHIGCAPDPVTGDVVPPIHVASTYVQDRPGQLRDGYEYGRCANPTTNAFAGQSRPWKARGTASLSRPE